MYGPFVEFVVPSYSVGGAVTTGGTFKIEGTVLEIGLLLPAVQKVRSAAAPINTPRSDAPRDTTTVSDDVWIDGNIITAQLSFVDGDRDGIVDAFVFDFGDIDGDGRDDQVTLDAEALSIVAEDTNRDGIPDSFWFDLGDPVADDGPTCDPSANPVLIVVANQDFYFNE